MTFSHVSNLHPVPRLLSHVPTKLLDYFTLTKHLLTPGDLLETPVGDTDRSVFRNESGEGCAG